MKQSMNDGVQVVFAEPVSQDENALAIALLHYVKEHPEYVADKRFMSYDEVGLPGLIVGRLCGKEMPAELAPLPVDIFETIVNKLMNATLVCRMTDKKGKQHVYEAPYFPVQYVTSENSLHFYFTEQPQCYFERVEESDGAYFRLKPLGKLRDFMRYWAKEYI